MKNQVLGEMIRFDRTQRDSRTSKIEVNPSASIVQKTHTKKDRFVVSKNRQKDILIQRVFLWPNNCPLKRFLDRSQEYEMSESWNFAFNTC